MNLKIYNSLTKSKEAFEPIEQGKIGLYVCGNTVYDYCHIGHARSMIAFDMIVRFLRYAGYEVNHVRNITDIDDKIIKRAHENNESWHDLTERFIAAQREDEKALNLLSPNVEPKATDNIPQIITLIEQIIANKLAYVADNGDVYFSVRQFEGYGKLSHRNVNDLESGVRVEIGEAKHDPLDFVLWKLSKPGEPEWDSPWGKGRPGWHIECSAMSTSQLGQPFDIHGGGLDLKFPHHENEIAQSEAACDKGFANVWMHAGLLKVDGEKMSKSLGNFFTIREVLEKHDPEVLRYFMLSSHYRSPVNYSEDNLHQARHALESLYLAIRHLPTDVEPHDTHNFRDAFEFAMSDDFNTSIAFSVLHDIAKEVTKLRKSRIIDRAAGLAMLLRELASIFGVLQYDPEQFLQGDVDADQVEALIQQREAARNNKEYAEADRIRDELKNLGVVIEDSSGKTTWRKL